MPFMGIVLGKKGPLCPDNDRVWQFFKDHPEIEPKWLMQGSALAEKLWESIRESGVLLGDSDGHHPIVVVCSDNYLLGFGVEPDEAKLDELAALMG